MRHRFAPLLLAVLLGIGTVRLAASVVVVDFTWLGATNSNAVHPGNWSGGSAPSGLGGALLEENLIFTTSNRSIVEIDAGLISSLSGVLKINDITFQNTNSFTFTGLNSPTLKLTGDLKTQAGNTVTFANTIAVNLDTGVHDADLATNSLVEVNAAVSGAGSLRKLGQGVITFKGAATYTGGTEVQRGLLDVDGGSLSHSGQDLVVGSVNNGGSGLVGARHGGDISAAGLRLGTVANSAGGLVLADTGTTATFTNDLFIGENGTGNVTVDTGASIVAPNAYLGYSGNVNGALAVDHGSTFSLGGGSLYVGYQGIATVTIGNGSVLTNGNGYVGKFAGSTGIVAIDGAGSHWNNTNDLIVGYNADGGLGLTNGGKVTVAGGAGDITLGLNSGAAGFMLIGFSGSGAGIVNATRIKSGSGTGEVFFATNGTNVNPYYFTKDGTSGGTPVKIEGNIDVEYASGYNVVGSYNNYNGSTFVNGSTVMATGSGRQFGTGTLTIGGGGTVVLQSTTLHNQETLVTTGGTLTGIGVLGTGSGKETSILAGGRLAPGLSGPSAVGTLLFDDLTLFGGGIMEINLINPTTGAGTGWDVAGITNYSSTAHIDASVTAGNPFVLKLISLDANGSLGAAGGFASQDYWWTILDGNTTPIDFANGFNPNLFSIDASAFTTNLPAGSYSLTTEVSGHKLQVHFSPVPEPSTYALFALGLGSLGLRRWRRRRA